MTTIQTRSTPTEHRVGDVGYSAAQPPQVEPGQKYLFVYHKSGREGEIWGDAVDLFLEQKDILSAVEFSTRINSALNFMGGDVSLQVREALKG